MQGHVILCGYGKYGSEISLHFRKQNIPFVVIDNAPERIEAMQKSENRYLYLEDDATHDEALIKAGIKKPAP